MEIVKTINVEITGVDNIVTLNRVDGAITLELARPTATYTCGEIEEIRDALTAVLGDAENLSGPWDRIEDVPRSVRSVLDKDDDRWTRWDSDQPGCFAGETFAHLNNYAPFRLS